MTDAEAYEWKVVYETRLGLLGVPHGQMPTDVQHHIARQEADDAIRAIPPISSFLHQLGSVGPRTNAAAQGAAAGAISPLGVPAQASARRGMQKLEKDAVPATAGENPATPDNSPSPQTPETEQEERTPENSRECGVSATATPECAVNPSQTVSEAGQFQTAWQDINPAPVAPAASQAPPPSDKRRRLTHDELQLRFAALREAIK